MQHGKTYANLEAGDDVLNIGLNRAVTLIAEKTRKGPRKAAASAPIPAARSASIRTKGGPIVAKNGRYGPYVSHDGVNATLPRDKTPETDDARRGGRADRCPRRARRPGRAGAARAGRASAPAPEHRAAAEQSTAKAAGRPAAKRAAAGKAPRKPTHAAE